MPSILGTLNSFIPFADPSRPLWHDILISAILCTVLYIAPQFDIQAWRSKLLHYRREGSQQTGNAQQVEDEASAHGHHEQGLEDAPEDLNAQFNAPNSPQVPEAPLPVALEELGEGDVADAEAGPAILNPHQPRPRETNREVGAKKAKSIARRNQQRAYNEWLREQGDAQRAEWARDEAKRNEELQAERERRAVVEAKVREKERKDREERKAKEESGRQKEIEDGKMTADMIEERLQGKGYISVAEIAKSVRRNEDWAVRLVKKEGLLGTVRGSEEQQVTLLTASGWLVRVSKSMMDEVYLNAAATCQMGTGKITWEQLGKLIQDAVIKKR